MQQIRYERRFDAGTGGPEEVAATVVVPDLPSGLAIVCAAGAGYTRKYWTKAYLEGPDFASWMAELGHIVVAFDHLGMGESGVPSNPDVVDLETMGAAAASVIDSVRGEMATGGLRGLAAPITEPRVILLGHSMGGAVSVVSQARHAAADALAVLGSTTLELAGLIDTDPDAPELTQAEARVLAMEVRAPALWGQAWGETELLMDYDRTPFRPVFYPEGTALDVMETDEADGVATPRIALLECATPALFAHRAKEITSPVFLGYGQSDLSPDPAGEVASFARSGDITLFRLPGSAHCHNLAPTRFLLWERLAGWFAALPTR
jgi:pimeloyl-ACP methyl ester carboxylesterase